MDTTSDNVSPRGEEWFLAQLEQPALPVDDLLAVIGGLRAAGHTEQATALAELLEDGLAARGQKVRAIEILRDRAGWQSADAATWKAAVERILGSDHNLRPLIPHAGFDSGMPADESLRRLLLLLALKPDVLCRDRTWGFGIVRNVDTFYARVAIDFERKSGHTLSLAYAAETLEVLADDHLLARLHRDPDGLRALAQNDPGEVVRAVLRSYGPVTVARLQEILVPRLVTGDDWKRFWDAARKGLKKDGLVDIPAKRTDPLRLLEKAKAFDRSWFESLAAERDLATVLSRVEGLSDHADPAEIEQGRRIVGDRLAFVVKGATRSQAALVARAAMLARQMAVPADQVDAADLAARFLDEEAFLDVTRSLPARCVRPLIDFLAVHDQARLSDLLIGALGRLNLTTLNEAMDFLAGAGLEERCAQVVRDAYRDQVVEVELVYWLARNTDRLDRWSLGDLPSLAHLALVELAKDYSGERLKVQNQLRSRFEQPEWLKTVLESMSDAQRRETVQRVRESPSWSELDRKSLLAQMVKLYPDLGGLLVSRANESESRAARERVTSFRSYQERQRLLEKIVTVDIPQNSKEIAVARSYGDLSENHEFKAAKEMQGILLRRRGELESMLHRVRATDFKGRPFDRVSLATGVVLRHADGRTERYYILGEWDQDTALGIISCDTKLARALEGRRAGDKVKIPGEQGEVECEVVEVTPLSPEVRAWMDGE